MIVGEGSLGCRVHIVFTVAFMSLRSCSRWNLFFVFLWIMEIGEFQGLIEGSLYPCYNCSCTRSQVCCNISPWRCNWSIYTQGKMKSQTLGNQLLGLMLQQSPACYSTELIQSLLSLPCQDLPTCVWQRIFFFSDPPERVQGILYCSPVWKIIGRIFSSFAWALFN